MEDNGAHVKGNCTACLITWAEATGIVSVMTRIGYPGYTQFGFERDLLIQAWMGHMAAFVIGAAPNRG